MKIPLKTHTAPSTAERVAKGLGYFSIALGTSELVGYKQICDFFGLTREDLTRVYGLREITSGVGILAALSKGTKVSPWLWARVVGDVLDILAYSGAANSYNKRRKRALTAEAVFVAFVLIDALCAWQLQREGK